MIRAGPARIVYYHFRKEFYGIVLAVVPASA